MYLRITPWQINGFDVAAYRERLLTLHRRVQAEGGLATRVHCFFVAAAGGITQYLRVHSPHHRTVCYDAGINAAAPAFP